MSQTVTAIRIEQLGGPEVLQPLPITIDAPGPGQALIRVAAAGINFRDVYERTGIYPSHPPLTPGVEGSGVVRAVGPGVTDVGAGDRVAWANLPGSYAEAVVGAADRLIAVPDAVDDATAAAIPLQGLTAHYLASDSHRIEPGQTVLIHAGAGGVGLLLTQIAKIRGARVITTVSTPDKGVLSRGAGADEVLVGYDGFPEKVREFTGGVGADAVYDGVGRATFDGSLAALRRRGMLVLFGGSSGQVPPFDLQRLNSGGSLSVTRPTLADFVATRAELLSRSAELFEWLADGRLQVRIGGQYPLADAGRAQTDLEARRTTGKLLLIP